MSKDLDSSKKQDNDNWSDQSKKRIVNDDIKEKYNDYAGDISSMSKQFFLPGAQKHLSLNRQNESGMDSYPPQQPLNSSKNSVGEEAEVSDAMVYLNRIKEEYADDMVTYDNFLETMRDFKFGKIDADEVCKAVRILFKDKPHLIDTFNEYLPNHLKFYGENNRANENMNRPFDRVNIHGQQHAQFRRNVFNPNPKIMHPPMPPHNNIHPMLHKMGPPPPHIHQPHIPGGIHPGMIPNYPPQNIQHHSMHSPLRVNSQTNPTKQQFYNYNGPQKHDDVENIKKKQANDYIQRVKKKYINQPEVYKTFVELLQNFQPNQNLDKIRSEINSLLWENPDLIEDFEKDFIPPNRPKVENERSTFQRIKKKLTEKNLLDDFLRCLNYYNQNFISGRDLLFMVEPILKSDELINDFKDYINFKEKPKDVLSKNYEKFEKIGSYRILPKEIVNDNQDPIAREVLNTTCVSCPTFDSEDANFVFIKRNIYEDTLFKIEDERSEADLILERLDYFITSLEIVYSNLQTSEISLRDIAMSPGIIKEILRNIYENSASEILEGILTNPKSSIPVLIKRLYSINKAWREKLRIKKKIWNETVARSYYKALDTTGNNFKTSEKSLFSMKTIASELEEGFVFDISDHALLIDTKDLFITYLKVAQVDNKKAAIPNLYDTVELIFKIIIEQNISFKSDFNLFCVYKFISLLYERLKEIKDTTFPPLTASRLAVNLNLQEDISIKDRYDELKNVIKDYSEKNIDSTMYEENVRMITDCKGYKLYNIKKIFSRIEKSIINVIDDEESYNSIQNLSLEHNIENGYIFNFLNGKLEISLDEEHVEKMEDVNTNNVFLEKTLKKKEFCGMILDDIKLCINEEKEITPIEDSELLYISVDSSVLKKK